MHVPEHGDPRPVSMYHPQQLLGAELGPSGLHVVEQLRDRRRNMAAQYIHPPERSDRLRILLRSTQVRAKDRVAARGDAVR
jgi:hypothetical protein